MTLADLYKTPVLSENLSKNATGLLFVTFKSEFQRLQNYLPLSKGEKGPCLLVWYFFKRLFLKKNDRTKNYLHEEENKVQYLLK